MTYLLQRIQLILAVAIAMAASCLVSCSTSHSLEPHSHANSSEQRHFGGVASSVASKIPGIAPFQQRFFTERGQVAQQQQQSGRHSLPSAVPLPRVAAKNSAAASPVNRSNAARGQHNTKKLATWLKGSLPVAGVVNRYPAKKGSNALAERENPAKYTRLQPNSKAIQIPKSGSLRVRTTAYTHTESDHKKYGRKNALGSRLKFGKVCSAAADWSRFPVGTSFRIAGEDRIFVVDDYGSALAGTNTLDLYMPSKRAMNRWGARNVNIQVVKWGSYSKSLKYWRERQRARHVRQMLVYLEGRIKSWEAQRRTLAQDQSREGLWANSLSGS